MERRNNPLRRNVRRLFRDAGYDVSCVVTMVLADNPNAIEDYRLDKDKAFGLLMGQVMKKLGAAGNPEIVRKTLKERFDN